MNEDFLGKPTAAENRFLRLWIASIVLMTAILVLIANFLNIG